MLTDEQMQEIQNCKGLCETCSIKQLKGDMPCFDFIVGELIKTRTINSEGRINDGQ